MESNDGGPAGTHKPATHDMDSCNRDRDSVREAPCLHACLTARTLTPHCNPRTRMRPFHPTQATQAQLCHPQRDVHRAKRAITITLKVWGHRFVSSRCPSFATNSFCLPTRCRLTGSKETSLGGWDLWVKSGTDAQALQAWWAESAACVHDLGAQIMDTVW